MNIVAWAALFFVGLEIAASAFSSEGQSLSSSFSTFLFLCSGSLLVHHPSRWLLNATLKPAEEVLCILLLSSDYCLQSDVVGGLFLVPAFRDGASFFELYVDVIQKAE